MSKQLDYFKWLCSIVDAGPESNYRGRHRLLYFLFTKEYEWIIPHDENRAGDALVLRNEFANDIPGDPKCLEVMVALAHRMETEIMDDPIAGDRTARWFCDMLKALDIYDMTDDKFDPEYACIIIDRWLSNSYEPNGYGSLFILNNCKQDAREMEIWYQMQWYLNEL